MLIAQTTALYVIVDDVLRALHWPEDYRREMKMTPN